MSNGQDNLGTGKHARGKLENLLWRNSFARSALGARLRIFAPIDALRTPLGAISSKEEAERRAVPLEQLQEREYDGLGCGGCGGSRL
jgi:hypothetical protein